MGAPKLNSANRIALAALILITAFAFAIRAHRLHEVPAGFYCDEAANGYNAHRIYQDGVDERNKPYPLFFWSFLAYKYPLYIYPSALWTGIFGLSEFSSRFQAAVYGAATVPVAFAIARLFAGNGAGVAAALLVAITPWSHHFSRIAFSLSGLPFWFGLGFLYLAKALGQDARRRDWVLAAFLLALTPYSYAPAQVLVPPLLGLALLLYADVVWRRLGWAAMAAVTMLVVISPFVYFFSIHLGEQSRYLELITVFTPNRTTAEALRLAGENWLTYYSERFLFARGDPNIRHGVRSAGMLYWSMAPWIAIGIVASLLKPDRRSKLLLIWLLLFPIGAAFNRETPAATRSITGSLLFPILAAVGVGSTWQLLRWTGWKRTTDLLVAIALVATLRFLVPEANAYLTHYFRDYSSYSAVGIYGFQYGWRQLFEYMEAERETVDRVRITTSDLNQPYIFRLMYVDRDPEEIQRWGEPKRDYRFAKPIDRYSWYDPKGTLLYAVRPFDMWIIDSWEDKTDIVGPGDHVAFHVLRNPKPKELMRDWETVGPFPNPENRNRLKEFIDIEEVSRKSSELANDARWRRLPRGDGFLELNKSMGRYTTPKTSNVEFKIAYLRTRIHVDERKATSLEVYGSGDEVIAWVNGVKVTPERTIAEPGKAAILPIQLEEGENVIVIKAIETVGDWWLVAHARQG